MEYYSFVFIFDEGSDTAVRVFEMLYANTVNDVM